MINKYKVLNALFPVEEVLELKNRGTNIKCPFHRERRPSAHIYSGDNHLYCFTCGKQYTSTDIAKVMGKSIDDMYADLIERNGGEETLLAEFKEVELKPVREKMIRSENETITDFADRYFGEK